MQTTNSQTVAVGTFDSRDKADAAISALYAAGFLSSDIGIIARRSAEWDDFSSRPATEAGETTGENTATGATAGAVAGAGVGGLWALGIAAGLLPALGPVIAGGVLANVLASAAAGAAMGGVGGALIGLGVPEEDARYYDTELAAGKTLVTVRAGSRYGEAMRILRDHGAASTSTRSSVMVGDSV